MKRSFDFGIHFMNFAALFVLTSLCGCQASDVPRDWKVDCVGRMQLSFPEEVDVAANTPNMIEREYKIKSIQPSFDFADGQHAGWSAIQVPNWIFVTHPLSVTEKGRLRTAAEQDALRIGEWLKTEKRANDFESLSVKPKTGIASRVGGGYDASIFVGDNLVRTWAGRDRSWSEGRKDFERFVDGIASRQTLAVPSLQGLCIPYAFIKDEGTRHRYIAMTYRLRKHPDVTILLKDQNAVETDPKANPAVYDPEGISDAFWSRYDSTYRKSLKSVWSDPYKRTKLADSKDIESFVKIVREDGSVDHGYLVVARGDPHAKQDTPDLMLYVIQHSKNAKAKGIEPIAKEAFIEMAQTIAASVKRRPISPP